MDARVRRAVAAAEPGKINVKLWALVIATIEANGKKYDQDKIGDEKPLCKSPACQAGWCQYLVDGFIAGDTLGRAQDLLRLEDRIPFGIFFGGQYDAVKNCLVDVTAKTIRAEVNRYLGNRGYSRLGKVRPVQLAARRGNR